MKILIYFFILELFFGFNGKLLVFGGISIRHWLFAIVLVFIYGKAFFVFLKKWEEEKLSAKMFSKFLKGELRSFSNFDIVLFCFLLLHFIWIIWIPYTKLDIIPEALNIAISSGISISIMALYFPAVYLLRNENIEWENYRKFVIGCFIGISVLHIVIYVLERIQWQYDHSYYFMERVFDAWERLVNGHCEIPQILMPAYAVRIIYGCNIFILMSFYFIIGQTKKKYILWALLSIVALFTTGTRSLILGIVVGIFATLYLDYCIHKWNKDTLKKCIMKIGIVFVVSIFIDSMIFQGMNVTRILSSFSVSEEVLEQGNPQSLEWTSSEYSIESEIRGTTNSNSTRILQVRDLVKKFMEHPFIGHGFVLNVCDMQGISYIVKVGLFGVLLWVIFLATLLSRVIKMEKREKGSAIAVVYIVVAVLVDVQLQCMFGSLVMAMAVFLFLDMEYKENKLQ